MYHKGLDNNPDTKDLVCLRKSFCNFCRYHWCTEAINVLEEMHNEMSGSGDDLEWHIRDVLALAYYQLSVMQYEEKVVQSRQDVTMESNVKDCVDISNECGDSSVLFKQVQHLLYVMCSYSYST